MTGKNEYLKNRFFSCLNRINKLTKYAKDDVHDFTDYNLVQQDREMCASSFVSKLEQIEELVKELKQVKKEIEKL